ncbi:LytR/AlgR family response regulator transcription factor [Massilia horti]|uniref:Response regulator transcription factor n=1 Tax=Massilia horti TaxID=2562153 RepID=A0A4Y9SY35_9BURK|nr:LytTR family DNA-binding domain-containing protein [Massilia horti]TFW31648.1 response regulator transcription factor [Massilia horti]
MTIRALIAEDEPILAATLAKSLQRLWPELAIVAICPNGLDAVEQALELRPDILFLDIKMPGQTGLEAADEVAERWNASKPLPQVVFVTAYDDYAIDAFEQAAADYVLKPVNDARLGKTVERLRQRLANDGANSELPALLAQIGAMLPAEAPQPRLSIIRAAVGNQVRLIPVRDVVYFQAVDKYVSVVTQEGEALIRLSLKELLPQLDTDQFCQIHRGTIVNLSCVDRATRDDFGKLTLSLKNRPEKLRVSLLYTHLFRQM